MAAENGNYFEQRFGRSFEGTDVKKKTNEALSKAKRWYPDDEQKAHLKQIKLLHPKQSEIERIFNQTKRERKI